MAARTRLGVSVFRQRLLNHQQEAGELSRDRASAAQAMDDEMALHQIGGQVDLSLSRLILLGIIVIGGIGGHPVALTQNHVVII